MNRVPAVATASCLAALSVSGLATGQEEEPVEQQVEQAVREEEMKQVEEIDQNAEVEPEAFMIGPPGAPLARGEMKRWEYNVQVVIGTPQSEDPYDQEDTNWFQCTSTRLVFPLVVDSNYTYVNPDTIKVSGMIGDQWQTDNLPWELRGPHPDGTAEVVLNFPAIDTDIIGMKVDWKAESWEATINEAQAVRAPWPTQWPNEAEKFLQPTPYIDSTSNAVVGFVRGITNDRQRSVPIYLAAKEIVRNVVTHFFDVNSGKLGSRELSSNASVIATGQGFRGDMTTLAVGCLRAAGIPARPVLGMGTYFSNELGREVKTVIIWAEFYLPGSGWVFFDPFEMRGRGIKLKSLDAPWPWFGAERLHVERTPISYRLDRPGNPNSAFCLRLDELEETSYGDTLDTSGIDIDYEGNQWGVGIWGWRTENCDTYGCDERRSISITRINRTGSLLD